jgi:hypothetical protein
VLRDRLVTGASGVRQGASEVGLPALSAAENAAAGKRRRRAGLVSSSMKEVRDAGNSTEAGGRRQAQLHPGSDCRKVVRRSSPDGIGAHASKRIAEGVIAAQAAGSGVGRYSGARIVCRLQKSVRSIFPVLSR